MGADKHWDHALGANKQRGQHTEASKDWGQEDTEASKHWGRYRGTQVWGQHGDNPQRSKDRELQGAVPQQVVANTQRAAAGATRPCVLPAGTNTHPAYWHSTRPPHHAGPKYLCSCCGGSAPAPHPGGLPTHHLSVLCPCCVPRPPPAFPTHARTFPHRWCAAPGSGRMLCRRPPCWWMWWWQQMCCMTPRPSLSCCSW